MTYGVVAVSVKGIAVVSMRTPLRERASEVHPAAIGSQFVGRGQRRRTIEQTLDLAWPLIGRFPRQRPLRRIAAEVGARYHQPTCVWRAQ
jgi:vacuolar-type H+-ATPase subunit B/Vma2